ncbi:MAG: hypothetical protein HZB56_06450 [Deltaproteobacteria bacterium]|nr:hypothetical protein [Deltaproteobacteria bacterium]
MTASGEQDPLEALRAQSGLSIDDEGRFRHRGEPITHARTLEVLWGSLRRRPDGRYQVQIGREVGLVEVPHAPYGVRGVTPEAGGLLLHLTDGGTEPLDPATLRLGKDGVLHCGARGEHRARFQRAAQAALGALLEEPEPGRFQLRLGGRAWPVVPE